jgi:hypothetical protein
MNKYNEYCKLLGKTKCFAYMMTFIIITSLVFYYKSLQLFLGIIFASTIFFIALFTMVEDIVKIIEYYDKHHKDIE